MTKKKQNIILVIPGFLLMGTALGVQTHQLIKHSVTGLIVGVIVYFFLKRRNKKISSK